MSKIALSLITLFSIANAHGFIKNVETKAGGRQRAQKTNPGDSSFRPVPDNTGWIGANFIGNEAIACGSSGTPFQTVAAPNGRMFAESGSTAGKHMPVGAGEGVTLTVSGNQGDGWPHPIGTVQTYLADCGESCVGADATKLDFFKIQSEVDGIQNTLRKNYDASQDGHKYTVTVPKNIPSGKYMLRYELIAYGQSGANEGRQDQYYAFCGQFDVTGGSGSLKNLVTVNFPGAYKNGNRDQKTAPGPKVMETKNGGTQDEGDDGEVDTGNDNNGGGNTVTQPKPKPKPSPEDEPSNDAPIPDDEEPETEEPESPTCSSSSAPVLSVQKAGSCASRCLKIKFEEKTSLGAARCSGASCFCAAAEFMSAFAQCAQDNCSTEEAEGAVDLLSETCAKSEKRRVKKMLKRSMPKVVKIERRLANHSRRAHKDNHRVKRSIFESSKKN